jgi:hypothetical protein
VLILVAVVSYLLLSSPGVPVAAEPVGFIADIGGRWDIGRPGAAPVAAARRHHGEF